MRTAGKIDFRGHLRIVWSGKRDRSGVWRNRKIAAQNGNCRSGGTGFRSEIGNPVEKFEPALALLDKALALHPKYARALFYKGVVLRLQNRIAEAAAVLREVVRQYPAARQGHQELGYVFYLKKDYQSARDEFEAVKAINPDDVTACYYLSIVYALLQNEREAQVNAQLYASHRDDPNYFALNLEYVQQNPNDAHELAPYHVHDK